MNQTTHLPRIKNLLLRDKLNIMLGNYAATTYGNVVVSSMSIYVLSQLIAVTELIIWFSLLLIYAIARIILRKLYFTMSNGSVLHTKRWAKIFTLSAFFAGAPWVYAAWFFVIETEPQFLVFMLISLMGLAAGAIGSNSGYFPTFVAYAVPFMLVLSIRVFLFDGFNYQVLAFLFSVYLWVLLPLRSRTNELLNNH